MLRLTSHGDVSQLRFSTRSSRAMGYAVSAYVTRGVLIDTGFPHAGRDLDRWLDGSRPQGAIVTHAHEDHAGNIDRLARRGVPVELATETEAMVRAPRPIGWYRRVCWGTARPLRGAISAFTHPALRLMPAPGHSPDHHVVWDAERETLFGGDLFIGVKVRIAHPGQDVRGEVRSLKAVLALRPKRFFDAHRGDLEHPIEQLGAKITWMEETIGGIERLAAAGWSDRAIRNAVLGREDSTGWVSGGDYARINLVRGVLRAGP
jgi:glyoxylase-like metal-dependent hydrolase (beta-lactamase superfamily II)